MNLETDSPKISAKDMNITNSNGDNVVIVAKENLLDTLRKLKTEQGFNFLMHIAGADYPDKEKRFEMSYELYSSKNFKRIRVKTSVAENESLESAIPVWKAANWFEREIYDMYGVKFDNHPNLRRILVHH